MPCGLKRETIKHSLKLPLNLRVIMKAHFLPQKLLFILSFVIIFLSRSNLTAMELVDKSIAVVNNEVILQSQLKTFRNNLYKEGSVDEALLSEGVKKEQLKTDLKASVDYLINERIIDSEVKKNKLEITMERVEEEIKDLAKRNNITRSELMATLRLQGYTESEYQDFLKTKIQRQNLLDQVIKSKIRISDEDILAFYYSQNTNKAIQVTEYELSHILFKLEDPDDLNKVLERAKSVYQKLQNGSAFTALAKEYSEDTDFQAGGFFGVFKTGDFASEIENAVSDLNQGDYSKIVRSRLGLHIFKVNKKRFIPSPAFEKEKARYADVVFERAYKRQLANWLQQKRETSFIRINL